jgi:hypothetical protein
VTRTSEKNTRSGRIVTWVFFAAVFGVLFVLGNFGQPTVHPYFDQVGIRDAGTVFSHCLAQPNPLKTLVGRAMLHIEGPLQFLVLNSYCYSVGDLLPLNPSTMQFPNTVFAFLATVLAYLLGVKLFSRRFGYCCALAFVLSPWLVETIRQPWYFNTLSCLLHFSVIYCFASLIEDNDSRFFRIAAPTALAAYLLTGMDWPTFLFSVGLFLVTCGRLKVILRNPYNLLVLAAGIVQAAWPIVLLFSGRERFLSGTMLLYPFLRYTDLAANPDFWSRVWTNVLLGWGPQFVLATIGALVYLVRLRKEIFQDRVRRALFDSTCVWFVVSAYALFTSSTSATYLYVAGVPTALLAGLLLSKMRYYHLVSAVIVMAVFQLYVAVDQYLAPNDDGRRVLAAATFLIEQRPDLLTEGKTAFLPRNSAANVGQYSRGRNRRIIMPKEFPVERRKHAIGSDERILLKFVDEYNNHGRVLADWLVLDSSLFSKDVEARDFYTRLRDDPRIRWIARFKDAGGELYIGEVRQHQGSPATTARLMDTKRLSDKYEEKYDRINFLKKNVEYVDHY